MGREVGVGGAGESGGRKIETTVLEQQLKKKKKKGQGGTISQLCMRKRLRNSFFVNIFTNVWEEKKIK